jgi:hypothetical protein
MGLKTANVAAQRWLRDVEDGSGFGEAAGFSDLNEVVDTLNIK